MINLDKRASDDLRLNVQFFSILDVTSTTALGEILQKKVILSYTILFQVEHKMVRQPVTWLHFTYRTLS